jgi:hypothetical protein
VVVKRAPHLRLIDGPLVDTQSPRTALVQSMANCLVKAKSAGSETASTLTLRACGFRMADITMLLDDARQTAIQEVVAEEMSEP